MDTNQAHDNHIRITRHHTYTEYNGFVEAAQFYGKMGDSVRAKENWGLANYWSAIFSACNEAIVEQYQLSEK